jgi:hypothetical protein
VNRSRIKLTFRDNYINGFKCNRRVVYNNLDMTDKITQINEEYKKAINDAYDALY